jgi:hypothetical protein
MYNDKDLLIAAAPAMTDALGRGQSARGILIVSQQGTDVTAEHAFLQKVLGAAQIDLERDTFLVSLDGAKSPPALYPLIRSRQPQVVLVFGWQPKELGIHIQAPKYQPFQFNDTTFLWADALALLEPDRILKGQLWTALKVLFVV